jgi:diaminopimelate decarboxylase
LVRRLATPNTVQLPPELWQLTRSGTGLALEGVELHDLLKQVGSPLHVVHAGKLRSNADAFLSARPRSIRCEVAFSYKTNPLPGALQLLHERGIWAEVISEYELWLALELGVPPERIVYNGPAKSERSVEEAIRLGLFLLNVNSVEELSSVARIAERVGRRVRLGIRIAPPTAWGGQFGVPLEKALAAFAHASTLRSVDLVGLHAHAGGQLRSEARATTFLAEVLSFTDQLHERIGLDLEVLDVGGSLAVPTVAPLDASALRLNQTFGVPLEAPSWKTALTPAKHVALVCEAVDAHYQSVGRLPPTVILEPGRALTGNTQMLLASVVALNASKQPAYAVLDAGINLAECVRGEYHQVFPLNRFGEACTRLYALAGPICSPGDVLYRTVRMPPLSVGDSVAIMDAGAYFLPFSTSFSFPQPGVVMIDEGRVVTLRRAETLEDLQRRDEKQPRLQEWLQQTARVSEHHR